MRTQRTRRAAQVAGAATVAVLALAGCSAGQTAETSLLETPVSGINTASPDGGLLVRDLQVLYNSPEGYPANSNAPLQVSLFNQTENPITVTISSQPQQTVVNGIVSAQLVGLSGPVPDASASTPIPATTGDASPSPSDPASPAPLSPAKLTIAALGSVTFLPGDQTSLIASGLTNKLASGGSLALTIQSSTSATPINVLAPVAIPLSPASRGPGIEGENSEGE